MGIFSIKIHVNVPSFYYAVLLISMLDAFMWLSMYFATPKSKVSTGLILQLDKDFTRYITPVKILALVDSCFFDQNGSDNLICAPLMENVA